jgi:hypothetical protein
MDISQEPFCMEIYRKNGRGLLRGHRFVRACAVEMHMDMPSKPFAARIYRKNASLHSRNAHGHFTRAIAWEFTGEMPFASTAASVLRELAQSKCT